MLLTVQQMFLFASVGHSVTVIQALARLLVITRFLEARFPGTLEAVPRGWLVDEFIEFVLAFDVLILVEFERKVLSQRDSGRVIRSWGRRGGASCPGASCKIKLACACVAHYPLDVAHRSGALGIASRRCYFGDEWVEPRTGIARAWNLRIIGRNFKCAIIVDLALGVLLRCAHSRFDGIGGGHSLGEASRPNSLPGFAAAGIVAEVKAAIGGAVPTVWVGVNLTGIFWAPNLIFVSGWQCCAGSADDEEGGGCD